MKELLNKTIPTSSSIVILLPEEADVDLYATASVLYTYILQLHKKVALVSKTEIDKKYFVIPWIQKAKKTVPNKSDLLLTCKSETPSKEAIVLQKYKNNNAISLTQIVFEAMKSLHVKINPKMATALYSGIFKGSDPFLSLKTDGTIFAFAKELIELGANHRDVVKYLQKYSTLSQVRLLGAMLLEMQLLQEATIAFFDVSYEMLQKYGASWNDCEGAMEKALELPTVRFAVLAVQMEDLHVRIFLKDTESFFCIEEFSKEVSSKEVQEKILTKVREIEKEKSK